MNDKDDDLITQSEAARLMGTSPSNISDKVRRGRYKVQLISGNKFLSKSEVLNLKKGTGGRPSKTKFLKIQEDLKKLGLELAKFKNPEDFYPRLDKFFFASRKYLFNKNRDFDGFQLWKNSNWKRNKRRLRKALENYPMSLMKEINCDEIYLTRKYIDSGIQEFFSYCLLSDDMYEGNFSVIQLKHKYISHCESQLGINSSIREREKELIVSMFKEDLSIFKDDLDIKSNPFTHCYNIAGLIVKDKRNLSRLKTDMHKKVRVARVLNEDAVKFPTKSWKRVIGQVRKEKFKRNRLKKV